MLIIDITKYIKILKNINIQVNIMKTLKNIQKTTNTFIIITLAFAALTISTNSQANEYTNITSNQIVFDWKKPKKDMP